MGVAAKVIGSIKSSATVSVEVECVGLVMDTSNTLSPLVKQVLDSGLMQKTRVALIHLADVIK